ncbi:MAG: 5'/3'-nucleotidase SurE [Anaerovorax sp.]|nr:5'/3'-nucleotidase SurE [Anaerovorax sp.]
MNVLVANDDGIEAQGIQELVKALGVRDEIKIYVCAPDRQRTASGHGITVSEPLILKEWDFKGAEMAYSCSGTPADCVKLGLRAFRAMGIEMDLVYSGINHGANLGTDTLYSGTVSAAMEGVLCGKRSIAISSCSHQPKHFESCYDVAVSMLDIALESLDEHTILNVNIPDLPLSEIKGIQLGRLGEREYADHFHPIKNEEGIIHYQYSGEALAYEGLSDDVDVAAHEHNYITVTPLHHDLTNYSVLEEMKNHPIFDKI